MKILLIFKDIVVESMTLFTKISLKGHEDNDLSLLQKLTIITYMYLQMFVHWI